MKTAAIVIALLCTAACSAPTQNFTMENTPQTQVWAQVASYYGISDACTQLAGSAEVKELPQADLEAMRGEEDIIGVAHQSARTVTLATELSTSDKFYGGWPTLMHEYMHHAVWCERVTKTGDHPETHFEGLMSSDMDVHADIWAHAYKTYGSAAK